MRCKFCLKTAASLRACSGCKSVSYCSRECQRKDWKEGLHKTECPQLKAASQRIKTAYGSFDAAEVAVRIHRAAEAVSCREEALAHTNSASPYATPGAEVHLISKVVLPSASVAAELAEDAKYATAREKLRLEVKEGRWFVDVLSYFFDGRLGVLKERYLNRNLADQFLLAVIGACDAKKMHFANDRAAQDYLTVVRANLSTIRMIMRDADARLMDALETLFYGLHWMEVQALMVAGRAKCLVGAYDVAEGLFHEAEAALDRMAPTFDSAGDEQQLVAVRKQIAAHRLRLPSKEVQELTKELERLKSEEEKTFDTQLVLRKLGLAQIRAGQVAIGRKNLVKSLNQLVKRYESVRDSLPTDVDVSPFLTVLGEAYELCALEAMPGEAKKTGNDVDIMQSKAAELFRKAGRADRDLNAKIRQWNWYLRGRVSLRRSGGDALEPHPDFSPRIKFNSPNPTLGSHVLSIYLPAFLQAILQDIQERFSLLEHAWPDQCPLCTKDLVWLEEDHSEVEILVECKHAFHSVCLDVFVEENSKECPKCQVAFSD